MTTRQPVRLGLRGQILMALCGVLLLAFTLLGLATVQLTAGGQEGTRLLLFYVALTGAAVLLWTYVALTHLIVRPLDLLTRSAERLAAGGQRVDTPERGAAEVLRLGEAFRAMSTQLRAERAALEARLQELEAKTDELQAAERQLIHGEKLASVGRLAAGVAHEIGNPLAGILGLVELLESQDLPPAEAREFLRRIHGETQRIHRIIRDLLDYSRQGADNDLRGTSCQLLEAVQDALNLVRPLKRAGHIDITLDAAPQLPYVLGARDRLTQLVLNLLLNAAEALESQERQAVGAPVSAPRIDVALRPRADAPHVELVVQDNGPGIASHLFATLFEPFTTTKPAGKGTGLGLAVCHATVDALGGSIRAENLVEAGACFSVRLPIARMSTPPPEGSG